VFVAPEAEIVILVVYVPGLKLAISTVPVTVPEPDPLAGLRLSQLAGSDTVQLSVPVPELTMENPELAGLLPPWVPENDKLEGLKLIVGNAIVGVGAAAMVSVTGRVCGVLLAPAPVMVMAAE